MRAHLALALAVLQCLDPTTHFHLLLNDGVFIPSFRDFTSFGGGFLQRYGKHSSTNESKAKGQLDACELRRIGDS